MDRFSELMGMPVRTHEGNRVGSLCDLTVELGTSPDIRRLALRHGRGPHLYVAWSQVAAFGPDDVRLAAGVSPSPDGLREHEALLGRDVLDTQVIDVAGKRLSRVSDVLLERPEDRLVVLAVDVSPGGVWRRLGLRRLAEHSSARSVEWANLHLTSDLGHQLQLTLPESPLLRLDEAALASAVASLPRAKAAKLLQHLPGDDPVTERLAGGRLGQHRYSSVRRAGQALRRHHRRPT